MEKSFSIKIFLYNKIEQFRKLSPATKASMALVFAKFFQRGLSMISGPIFTRIMPQAEYGIISTFTSWQDIFFIVATLNMSSGVFNNGMLDFEKDRDSFSFSILCLANILTIVWGVLYWIFRSYLSPIMGMPTILIIIMFLYFMVTPAYNYWMGRQRFEFKYKAVTLVMICSSIFSVAIAIFAVTMQDVGQKAIAKIVATESVAILVGIFFYLYLVAKSKFKLKLEYWKYALSFNLPLVPHYLSMYVLSGADRIMITNLVDSSATAIYNVAYTVASIILIFWNSIDAAYAPWIYQNLRDEKYQRIRSRGNQILILFAMFAIVSALLAPEIIYVLAPANYYNGVYVIPSVTAGIYFTAVFSLYMRVELYLKKTKVIMMATVSAALLNCILNYIFIPIYGYYAAGYTTLVCYALLALLHCWNISRLGYKDVYDNKKILLISIGMLLFVIGISFSYSHSILRYMIIAVICIGIIKNRKKILSIIKNN